MSPKKIILISVIGFLACIAAIIMAAYVATDEGKRPLEDIILAYST
jgi:hypothetical protein